MCRGVIRGEWSRTTHRSPVPAGTCQRKREVKCVEERMNREAGHYPWGWGRTGIPSCRPRRVIGSDRNPERKDYLKDNEETMPGRAVGKGTRRRPRRALIRRKGEEQDLVTVKRMWHPPRCHKGGHSSVGESPSPCTAQRHGDEPCPLACPVAQANLKLAT